MDYRSDIDGLRTLAVVPVIIYHAGLGFPGGFIGVDVFFVISGYLITFLIVSEIDKNNFSIVSFYERRARRLFPALFVMLATTALLSAVIMVPVDLEDFGKSLVTTTIFGANIWFYTQEGYFNEAAELQPLLHTWSLGVEEQYYFMFPIIIVVLSWFFSFGYILTLLACLALISITASVVILPSNADAAFYLPHLRAWELLLGSLLALATWRGWVEELFTSRSTKHFLSAIGLITIIWPIFMYNSEMPFPGLSALLPCIGAVLLIAAGGQDQGIGTLLLSARPMVFIGKLSYSLYLWHWPIISLGFYMTGELSIAQGIACLILSSIAAFLSWRFVEQPFRNSAFLGQRAIFSMSFGAMFLSLTVGVAFWKLDGLTGRMDAELFDMGERSIYMHDRRDCHFVTAERASEGDVCLRGSKQHTASFVLLGDSHADAISPAIFQAAEQLGLAGYQYTDSDFLPLPGVSKRGQTGQQQIDALTIFLDGRPDVKTLIISRFWQHQLTGHTYRHAGDVWTDDAYDGSGSSYSQIATINGLIRLAEKFSDRQFVLLDDVPSGQDLHIRAQLRLLRFNANKESRGMPAIEALAQRQIYEPYLIQLAEEVDNIHYQPIFKGLCNPKFCPLLLEGELLFRDGDHLSWNGALRLTDVARTLLSTLP